MDIEDYESLPEDSELALITREEILRSDLWNAISEHSTPSYDVDRKLNYISKLMAFHDAHELSLIKKPDISRYSQDFDFKFDSFLDDINYLSEKIRVAHVRRIRSVSTIVILDAAAKKQIHHWINKIREFIQPIELPIKKKEALYKRLSALAYEIDCERTKVEAFGSTMIEVCSIAGKAAQELKPVKELLDSVGSVIGKAKDAYEIFKLSAPKEMKRIEPPKKQLPAPEVFRDEIPF